MDDNEVDKFSNTAADVIIHCTKADCWIFF